MKKKWMAIPILAAALHACTSGKTNTKDNDIAEIPVIKLSAQDTSITSDYVADLQAIKNVEIRSRVNGFIDRILVDEGQIVKKGQVLFVLSSQEYKIAIDKGKASLASAQSSASIAEVELERIKTLVGKKVISASEQSLGEARLSDSQAKIKLAKAMIAEANQKLSYTQIRAPFNGVIDRIPFKAGSLVNEGSLLTNISNNSQMYAYFDISENEYLQFARSKKGKFEQNAQVKLILSDGTIYPAAGKIETHESAFSDNTGSIAFRAIFPNSNQILKHGASGKVRLRSELLNSILIPQKAVFEIQDKSYVFVVNQNNTVRMKSFTPTMSLNTYYVLGAGLSSGETIVYEGIQNIRDGVVIKPVYTQKAQLAKK
ncbi:efflux RND transporter periplasmic adaptor subunit [Pedobacter sp. CFBP9032]|uniref:efflux RND transporter periplasmic adaptor subunit n=1 Tax=Pedobacter sp. CFBP9032 TaxID=3096539 RepID=UPI002A6A6AE0|nr:efflux RND transporter periplasmic adaptor subunit [Pedobacter sp. CFBP9032]MDY0904710.1 efflux RND transporter periplasmic adaptor subunit [Pedobacter sp. CFBP9032]